MVAVGTWGGVRGAGKPFRRLDFNWLPVAAGKGGLNAMLLGSGGQ